MAILINDNYNLSSNKPFDARYLNISTPWASLSAATTGIPTYRYSGLTVNIAGEEYWWKDGLGDGDLVQKSLGGTSNLTGATNGLSLFNGGTFIGLGGTLTGNTTIDGAHTFNIGSNITPLTNACINADTFYVTYGNVSGGQCYGWYNANASSGNQINWIGDTGNVIIEMNNESGLKLYNSQTPTGAIYNADYSAGYIARSIPDVGYVTGYTQSAITGSSNTVSVCNVYGNYTATTTNDFIGVSGATDIYLPPTPKPCQRITVSDICGNALSTAINVWGNGNCINGDSGATINTDYGSMTFINNGYFWSAVAFIN